MPTEVQTLASTEDMVGSSETVKVDSPMMQFSASPPGQSRTEVGKTCLAVVTGSRMETWSSFVCLVWCFSFECLV